MTQKICTEDMANLFFFFFLNQGITAPEKSPHVFRFLVFFFFQELCYRCVSAVYSDLSVPTTVEVALSDNSLVFKIYFW